MSIIIKINFLKEREEIWTHSETAGWHTQGQGQVRALWEGSRLQAEETVC